MKILIGYDGSESSDEALKDLRVAGLPDSVDARLVTIADVFVPPPITAADDMFPMQVPPGVRRAHERAEQKLAEAARLATQASEKLKSYFPKWKLQHEALADSPAWAIVRIADEWRPNLIVVGAHGHSVLGGRLILGSVSQRVLYEANASVRVARGGKGSSDSVIRIIVGLDGSPHSHAAVDAVSQRQWPKGTAVRLVSVVDTIMAVSADPSDQSVLSWLEVDDDEKSEKVRRLFEPLAEKLRAAGLDTSVVIRRGKPKDELVEEATRWNADNIFLGAKGMRGIERLLLGSVSAAVAASAPCSVEVIRP
ncbi:MAG TPA: universal stress protein [Pyrinomonadaceae bacterium]|jgi:nucleotide-binding universal stress UspA family protein